MPVVLVGRGTPGGFVPLGRVDLTISGSNLSSPKARMLLMACLLRFGALPPVGDIDNPSADELRMIRARLQEYQEVFDTH